MSDADGHRTWMGAFCFYVAALIWRVRAVASYIALLGFQLNLYYVGFLFQNRATHVVERLSDLVAACKGVVWFSEKCERSRYRLGY